MVFLRQNLLVWLLAAAVPAIGPPGRATAGDIEAITRPSKDNTLSFIRAGTVKEVPVKEGHAVQAGKTVLIQLDDQAERLQVEQLKAEAEQTVRVRAARAQLDQKKVDLRKIEWAYEHKAATRMEVEHAKLEVLIAQLSLELAEFEKQQAQRKHSEAEARLEQMCLISPIDGRVETIHVREGESVDALGKAVRVVQIDPLWVDVPVPLERARRLQAERRSTKAGLQAAVTYKDQPSKAVNGRVIWIATVADAASDTLTVRVEVPNPGKRPAGDRVRVSFEAAAQAGSKNRRGPSEVASFKQPKDRE